jgi:adenosylhomocysteine nucleosidase
VRRARPSARVVAVPGGAAAASALPAFDDGETVVVLGLCGALRRLRAGDVVVYTRVSDDRQAFAFEQRLVDSLSALLPGAHVVNACTAKSVVTTVADRMALANRFDADVVDMEGTHLAAGLAARGVRFAMARVVSDDTARDLPPIADAIGAAGSMRPLRIAAAFARAPRAALAFVRNARRALVGLSVVARAVGTARLD